MIPCEILEMKVLSSSNSRIMGINGRKFQNYHLNVSAFQNNHKYTINNGQFIIQNSRGREVVGSASLSSFFIFSIFIFQIVEP